MHIIQWDNLFAASCDSSPHNIMFTPTRCQRIDMVVVAILQKHKTDEYSFNQKVGKAGGDSRQGNMTLQIIVIL